MRVYKPTYTKPMPEKAKIFTRKGKRYAKFKDAKGHTTEARLTKSGDKILVETAHWHIEFEDKQQIRRRLKAFTHEQATKRLAERIEEVLGGLRPKTDEYFEQIPNGIRDELISFGVLDAKKEPEPEPEPLLSKHIADFVDWLKTTKYKHGFNRADSHIRVVAFRIRSIIKSCGFERWGDLKQQDVEMFLGRLPAKPSTYNGYVTAIKQFCSWMVEDDKAEESPVRKLKLLNVPDEEHRRSLAPKEVTRLLRATENSAFRYGMSGHERAVLYLLLVETGIRRGALTNLTVSDFSFETSTIIIDAEKVKQRKKVVRYLKRERAVQLKEFFRNQLPSCKLFNFPTSWRSAEMVRDDLKETAVYDLSGKVILPAIPQYDDQGKKADLHSLKHTYATALDKTDATLAERMDLTGHSRKKSLTLGTYTHTDPKRLQEIVEQLPFYDWPQPEQGVMTGTDSNFLPISCKQGAHKQTEKTTDGISTAKKPHLTPSDGNNKGEQWMRTPHPKRVKIASNTQKQGLSKDERTGLAEILFSNPDLQQIINAWPNLSEQAKHIILKMVELAD